MKRVQNSRFVRQKITKPFSVCGGRYGYSMQIWYSELQFECAGTELECIGEGFSL
jgi:hypothetical protein